MTEEQIKNRIKFLKAEIRRRKRTLRFTQKNKDSIIRRGGIVTYKAMLDNIRKGIEKLRNELVVLMNKL